MGNRKSLFSSEVFSLELRNLETFVRSEMFLVHLIEIVLGVVVLALAILLISFFTVVVRRSLVNRYA